MVLSRTLGASWAGTAERGATMARWSSGYDGGLSRRKHGFDSRTGHQISLDKSKIADIILTVGKTVRREKAQELFFAYFLFGESKVGAD